MDDLEAGAYGILEPKKSCALVTAADIDFAVVPCLSFDRKGRRLGQGGGYYDRYLQMYPKAVTFGYAFEEQLCEAIPNEAHDRRLDFVVTQKECYEAECRPN